MDFFKTITFALYWYTYQSNEQKNKIKHFLYYVINAFKQ